MPDIRPEVELIGEDGNAFAILGACSKAARRAGWTKEEINEFTEKAMAGDYDRLLGVVQEYFEVS